MAKKPISITFRNFKSENGLAMANNAVKYLIHSTELNKIKNQKTWVSGVSDLAQSVIDCDIWTLSEETVRQIIPETGSQWLKARTRILELQGFLENNPVKSADYAALTGLDKLFVSLQAHKNVPSITMDSSVLTDMDFESIVKLYFENSTDRQIKSVLVSFFHKLMEKYESDGLLYPLKIRKSDLSDKDLNGFLSGFCKGVTTNENGHATWNTDFSKDTQLKALSDLFIVLFDSEDVEVIK